MIKNLTLGAVVFLVGAAIRILTSGAPPASPIEETELPDVQSPAEQESVVQWLQSARTRESRGRDSPARATTSSMIDRGDEFIDSHPDLVLQVSIMKELASYIERSIVENPSRRNQMMELYYKVFGAIAVRPLGVPLGVYEDWVRAEKKILFEENKNIYARASWRNAAFTHDLTDGKFQFVAYASDGRFEPMLGMYWEPLPYSPTRLARRWIEKAGWDPDEVAPVTSETVLDLARHWIRNGVSVRGRVMTRAFEILESRRRLSTGNTDVIAIYATGSGPISELVVIRRGELPLLDQKLQELDDATGFAFDRVVSLLQ